MKFFNIIKDIFNFFSKNERQFNTHYFYFFRFFLGSYLAYYYFTSLPYVAEIYSNMGLLRKMSSQAKYFSEINFFTYFNDSVAITIVTYFAFILSISLALGFKQKICCILLWYFQTIFVNQNTLTSEPSIPYVGFLLLTLALFPAKSMTEEVFKFKKFWQVSRKRNIANSFYLVPLFVFSFSLTASGIIKLQSESWRKGIALSLILDNPISKVNILTEIFRNNELLSTLFSYGALWSQVLALPIFFIGRHRLLIYLGVVEFVIIYFTMHLEQVAVGMIIFMLYFLLFDKQLIVAEKKNE